MWLECESEFDPVSPLSQNVEHAKMGRWALKWEDPVYPRGIWLEWNLPSPGNLFAREGDIQAFFDIFMLNSSTEHLPSPHPCLHLLLGFLCGWLQSHGPSGTPGNGIMRQVSVRHRGCERLVSVWLKSLMSRVLGLLSNHNPRSVIIPDQDDTLGWWMSWLGNVITCMIMFRETLFTNLKQLAAFKCITISSYCLPAVQLGWI